LATSLREVYARHRPSRTAVGSGCLRSIRKMKPWGWSRATHTFGSAFARVIVCLCGARLRATGP